MNQCKLIVPKSMPLLRSVQGNIHQGILGIGCISGSLGTQCTAIALVALLFASFRVDIDTWAPQHLDTIIFEGDTLYSRIVNDRFQGDTSRYLGQNELPAQFNAFGENYCQSLVETFVGAVNDLPAVSEAGGSTLQDALELGLEISPGLIGTFGESSIAVFRSNELFFVCLILIYEMQWNWLIL